MRTTPAAQRQLQPTQVKRPEKTDKTAAPKVTPKQAFSLYMIMLIMSQISDVTTVTMSIQQAAYQQTMDAETKLGNQLSIKQMDKMKPQVFKAFQLKHQSELGDLQNRGQVESTSMSSTGSSATTMMSQTMKVAQTIGSMWQGVVAAWSM